jgi:mannose-6-phosphate isomerase-like protein (cupin superfamily)
MNKAEPHLLPVRTIEDERGKLGVVEALPDAGFVFKRLYFLYDVKDRQERGQHAHKNLEQLMMSMHGSFRITLKGGGNTFDFELKNPGEALYIPPGYWRDLSDFTPDAVCLVAASEEYDENDYIRDYDAFLEWEKSQ